MTKLIIAYKNILVKDNCTNYPAFYIRKTFPCNIYPLEPRVYIAEMGYAGVYPFFLFLLQNIDCGCSLEPPRRGGSNVYPQSMFCAKIRKNIKKFLVNFSIFTVEK